MPLRVGIIGAGAAGSMHVRTLTSSVPDATITELFDPDGERAASMAAEAGCRIAGSASELIESNRVDAVIVASPDFAHTEQVLACLAAGKHVLCEKPLAANADDASRIVEAELELGRRLIQVGFMRRYDPGFVDLKLTVASGRLGEPRIVHNVHRNAWDTSTTADELIAGSMIHELDGVAWLLDDEIVAIRVESPVAEGLQDPVLGTLRLASGVLATVEVFVNARYGYDVRCEVVGTEGTATLEPRSPILTRLAGTESVRFHDDFDTHFAEAYRIQLTQWVRRTIDGVTGGPSVWDGFRANLIADAGRRSLRTGLWEAVEHRERPALHHAE